MALDPDGENVPRSGAATPASSPIELAVQYGRAHFRRHMKQHMSEVQALYSFILYLPSSLPGDPDAGSPSEHLQYLYETVPFKYHRFLDNSAVHAAYLVPLFQADFCAYNHLARDAPLQTAVEVSASGALTKILKVRQVMKMRGNEWSQANELPVSVLVNVGSGFIEKQSADANPATTVSLFRLISRCHRICDSIQLSLARSARSRRQRRTHR